MRKLRNSRAIREFQAFLNKNKIEFDKTDKSIIIENNDYEIFEAVKKNKPHFLAIQMINNTIELFDERLE